MLRVLIVDDSLVMRKKIKRVMDNLGHMVVAEARSAEEAISQHTSLQIDLITMDITMAGADGIHATTAIMASRTDTKIIMITSHGQEDMVVDALKAGAVGYILKPIDPNKVREAINSVFKIQEN